MLVALAQLFPGAERLGQPLELDPRLAVLGVELEGRARGLEGPELVAPARLPEARRLAEHGHLLVDVLREAEALFVEANEQAPVVGALVERPQDLHDAGLVLLFAGEGLELFDRLGVPGHLGDDGLELIDGAGVVAELAPQQAREGEPVGRGLLAVGGALGAAEVEIGEIAILAQLAVELGERVERAGVALLDVERGAVRIDRLLGLLQLGALEVGDGVERVEPLLVVAVVERGAVERDPLGVALPLDEEGVDRREELARLGPRTRGRGGAR